MAGINIAHWTYDRHNALYYFITNADDYIYMRYGGRDSVSADRYLNLSSLKLALEQGLVQHELYQAGKLPPQPAVEPRYPRDIPALKELVIRKRSCVECHHIADYLAQQDEQNGTLDKIRTMFPYPDINRIGIELDIPLGLVVQTADGPAAEAGMRPGDQILAVNDRSVFTFGDLQHEYDQIPRDAAEVSIRIARKAQPLDLTVSLPNMWWYYDVAFRHWSVDPLVYFDAEPLSEDERLQLDLPPDGFACRVTDINPIAIPLKIHSLQKDDIITAVDGIRRSGVIDNAQLYIRLQTRAGEHTELSILRGSEAFSMTLKTKRQYYRQVLPPSK